MLDFLIKCPPSNSGLTSSSRFIVTSPTKLSRCRKKLTLRFLFYHRSVTLPSQTDFPITLKIMSKDVFIFLLVKVWKISYQTCWVVSSQFFSWCRVSACWNKIWVELSILNRSEAKFELVMIPTLLLFKCNLLCYHVRNKWGKTPVTKSVNHNRIYLLQKAQPSWQGAIIFHKRVQIILYLNNAIHSNKERIF